MKKNDMGSLKKMIKGLISEAGVFEAPKAAGAPVAGKTFNFESFYDKAVDVGHELADKLDQEVASLIKQRFNGVRVNLSGYLDRIEYDDVAPSKVMTFVDVEVQFFDVSERPKFVFFFEDKKGNTFEIEMDAD